MYFDDKDQSGCGWIEYPSLNGQGRRFTYTREQRSLYQPEEDSNDQKTLVTLHLSVRG